MGNDDRLNLEILGLLLQVAWADHAVEAAESDHILERARTAGLGQDHLERLEACLRGEATLPPPDLGFLRDHADEALAAVEHFMGGGDPDDTDTTTLIAEVRELLNVGSQ